MRAHSILTTHEIPHAKDISLPPTPTTANLTHRTTLEHIRPSFLEAARLERPRCMPNSWLPPVPIIKAGVLCLGDAVNMRHPLTG